MPTIIEIFTGMVSPSVGLVKIAVEVMWLLVLPRTVVSGRSRKSMMGAWKMKAATVLTIQAIALMMRTRRSSSRCSTMVMRRSSLATRC